MRPIALGLVLAACTLPAFAAEPDGPGELITKTEAVRIAVQNKLSPKSATARKTEQAALVEYYAVPDQPLIWVDDKGLNERARLAMAEIVPHPARLVVKQGGVNWAPRRRPVH